MEVFELYSAGNGEPVEVSEKLTIEKKAYLIM